VSRCCVISEAIIEYVGIVSSRGVQVLRWYLRHVGCFVVRYRWKATVLFTINASYYLRNKIPLSTDE